MIIKSNKRGNNEDVLGLTENKGRKRNDLLQIKTNKGGGGFKLPKYNRGNMSLTQSTKAKIGFGSS